MKELTKIIEEHRVSYNTKIVETGKINGQGLYFILSGEGTVNI